MKKMRTLLILFLSVFALAACSDDDSPTVSFSKNAYVMLADKDLEVVVNLSQVAGSDIEIPVTIGGSAEKGTDYEMSAENFIVKAGESSAKMVISPKDNYDEDKVIIFNLGSVAGYDMGTNQVVTVAITPKEKYLYTFEKEFSVLENSLDVVMKIFDAEGNKVIPSKDVHIPFEIDESSTAVLGTTFSVEDDLTEFVIPAGESEGKITLNYIENTEVDKNKLVLSIPELGPGFIKGGILSANVNVYGASLSKLFGKWVGVKLSTKDFLVNNATSYGYPNDTENLPEDVEGEILLLEAGTIDMLKPTMDADLANFFRESPITYKGIESYTYMEDHVFGAGGPPKHDLYVFEVEKANVNFSATNETLRASKIAMRVTEIDGVETLEMTVIDIVPTDFYTGIYGIMGTMDYDPIRFHFHRAKE